MRGDGQDGYATPAAAVISFAIAIVVATLTVRGTAELGLAKAELAAAQTDYALAAAQNAAMAVIATSSRPPPYRWVVASQGEAVAAVAEPERPKLSLTAAMALDDDALMRLGADDPQRLRHRLASAGQADRLIWTADQESVARWRACAPAYVSPYGAASQMPAQAYGEPEPAQQPGLWRAGEVWRIQVTLPSGWRDERIVRFTGNGVNPVAVLGRRLSRVAKGQQTCEPHLEDTAGA